MERLHITDIEKREEMRREFTSNVSHELKTPLTVIMGFAEMLKSDELDKEMIIDFSSEIYAQAKRLNNIVHDTIRLSELEQGAQNIKKESVDLNVICERVIESLRTKANEKNISISFDSSICAHLIGNEFFLSEMVFNLLDNSIRYNKNDGKIDIKIHKEEKSLLFEISDTGIGIPSEDIDRIFERFYRVDKARSRENGGTGLGLSIVKHVALFHSAEIKAQSQIGVGTRITVSFPI